MKWVRISIDTSHESEDALSDLLMEMGSGGAQIEDDSSNPDRVAVSAYFPPDDMIGERVSKVAGLLKTMREMNIDVGAGRISIRRMDETRWTEPWKEFFKPISIGQRILVYPSWEDAGKSPSRDILIQIDPQMAFGAGRHSTTILCLELLEDVLKGGESVVDVGAGSGILAIAAVKLGARQVVAIDIDLKAVPIARENARINGVGDRIHVICGGLLNPISGKYDVIVSNIGVKMIRLMMPDFKAYLNEGGKLILTAILKNELSEIKDELESDNLTTLQTRFHEEWAAILMEAPR